MNFIDNDNEFILIIKYIFLNNLTKLQKILSKKIKIILYQILQIFIYLYNKKNIIYRDIKSKNIFVRFKTFKLFIKIYDFDLSTQSKFSKIYYKIIIYIVAKIFIKFYIKSINI